MKSSFALVALVALGVSVLGGCASAPERQATSRSSLDGYDPGASGGSGIDVNPSAVRLDNQNVYFAYDTLTVCEVEGNRGLTDQLSAIDNSPEAFIVGSVPHVVIVSEDGSMAVTKHYEQAERRNYGNGCNGGSWTLSNGRDSIDHIRNMDLSGAFGFSSDRFGCDGGFSLSDVQVSVKNLFLRGGGLSVPDVALDFTGETAAGAKFGCEAKFPTGTRVVFAGAVPIVYEIEFTVRLEISANRPTTLHGHVGADGASIEGGESTFTITPQVQVGVTFYKAFGGYVGVKAPFEVTPNPPCKPSFKVSAVPFVGAELGAGIGEAISLDHQLAVETNLGTLWSHEWVDHCQ